VSDLGSPVQRLQAEPVNLAGIELKSRPRVYGDILLCGYLTLLNAPGGTGKSVLSLAIAVSMAIGRDLLELCDLRKPRKVLLINNEDPDEELQLRLSGILQHYRLTEIEERWLQQNLLIRSGYQERVRLVAKTENGILPTDELKDIIDQCQQEEIQAVFIDPFVSVHNCSENDNGEMEAVLAHLRTAAARGQAAMLLVHHSRKGSNSDTPDDNARGASAIVAGVRGNYFIARMRKEDAKLFVMQPDEYLMFFRLYGGKRNYAPPAGEGTWFELLNIPVTVTHWESLEETTDWVGVPVQRDLELAPKFEGSWTLQVVLTRVINDLMKTSALQSPLVLSGAKLERLQKILAEGDKEVTRNTVQNRLKTFPHPGDPAVDVLVHNTLYRCWSVRNPQKNGRIEYHYEEAQ
jgi:hypothetical protein